MKSQGKKEPSQRQLRVGEQIRHTLSSAFMRGDVFAKELQGVSITVSQVSVSPDMRHALAYVMPLGGGDAESKQAIVAALNEESKHLSHLVAKQSTSKYSPRVRFTLDDTYDNASHIDALLRKAKTPPLSSGEK